MTTVQRICVEIPLGVPSDGLFLAVADAVEAWEPADRDGWDVMVYSTTAEVEPEPPETGWRCPDCGIRWAHGESGCPLCAEKREAS